MQYSIRFSTLMVAVTLASFVGCSTPEEAGKVDGPGYESGKADGLFEVAEVGPLELVEPTEVSISTRVPAYRVESYGSTTLELDLLGFGVADPLIVVEDSDGNVIADDDDGGDGFDSRLTVTLEQPGLYRVVVGTYDTLSLGQAPSETNLTLDARCTANCSREAIPAVQFLAEMRETGELEILVGILSAKIEELVPEETLRQMLLAQLQTIAASPDFAGIERFPVLPLRGVGNVRPMMGLLPDAAPSDDVVIQDELMRALGACMDDRTDPGPLNPALPTVGYGHYPNRAFTACQVSHSQGMSRVLTALAANNGSAVEYNGQTIETPRELFAALIETGHRIEVRNERTYANFTSLTYQGRDVIWPVWLDTGEEIGGNPLLIPTGHSHHAWRIHGPDVSARVMFYLGISGAAFFAQTSTRPGWCGEVVSDRAFSDEDEAGHVLNTVDAAMSYMQRIRVERTTVADGMPADGYGYLGVCNDSNAVIEYVTRGTISAFPLLRSAGLDAEEPLGDGLDDALRALPHDGDVAPARSDTLTRVLAMTPHDLDSPDLVDEGLRAQLQAAQAEVSGQ